MRCFKASTVFAAKVHHHFRGHDFPMENPWENQHRIPGGPPGGPLGPRTLHPGYADFARSRIVALLGETEKNPGEKWTKHWRFPGVVRVWENLVPGDAKFGWNGGKTIWIWKWWTNDEHLGVRQLPPSKRAAWGRDAEQFAFVCSHIFTDEHWEFDQNGDVTIWLVKVGISLMTFSGWWFEPLWKIWKSVGMIIPNIWENKKCSKPPTSFGNARKLNRWLPRKNAVRPYDVKRFSWNSWTVCPCLGVSKWHHYSAFHSESSEHFLAWYSAWRIGVIGFLAFEIFWTISLEKPGIKKSALLKLIIPDHSLSLWLKRSHSSSSLHSTHSFHSRSLEAPGESSRSPGVFDGPFRPLGTWHLTTGDSQNHQTEMARGDPDPFRFMETDVAASPTLHLHVFPRLYDVSKLLQ